MRLRAALTAIRPKTDRPAKSVHAGIPVTPAPSRRYCQPHLIRDAHPVHRLQQQIQVEAQLHFHDRQPQLLTVLYRDDIAAASLRPSREILLPQESASPPDRGRGLACHAACGTPLRRSNIVCLKLVSAGYRPEACRPLHI